MKHFLWLHQSLHLVPPKNESLALSSIISCGWNFLDNDDNDDDDDDDDDDNHFLWQSGSLFK